MFLHNQSKSQFQHSSSCFYECSFWKWIHVHDLEYFEKYKDNGKGSPEDRELFREMQSLGDYNYRDLQNPRLLLGPMPSLNTHVHLPWLAPIIDWHEAANIVKDTKLK